ncbi:putative protein lysine methyltransferase [Colletotrichum karsti]|uniref:SET domain-containing protein n=1 Tax=Colletotrichum karsti TaxID=1095194 RepID=A0A9P6HWX9_9PEZI|nr:putative protein lysine methyltransferase [Colletotrichum karsti]KAF9871899.1 putative protein lysine methyltransferase [Colletotrichum karsti]
MYQQPGTKNALEFLPPGGAEFTWMHELTRNMHLATATSWNPFGRLAMDNVAAVTHLSENGLAFPGLLWRRGSFVDLSLLKTKYAESWQRLHAAKGPLRSSPNTIRLATTHLLFEIIQALISQGEDQVANSILNSTSHWKWNRHESSADDGMIETVDQLPHGLALENRGGMFSLDPNPDGGYYQDWIIDRVMNEGGLWVWTLEGEIKKREAELESYSAKKKGEVVADGHIPNIEDPDPMDDIQESSERQVTDPARSKPKAEPTDVSGRHKNSSHSEMMGVAFIMTATAEAMTVLPDDDIPKLPEGWNVQSRLIFAPASLTAWAMHGYKGEGVRKEQTNWRAVFDTENNLDEKSKVLTPFQMVLESIPRPEMRSMSVSWVVEDCDKPDNQVDDDEKFISGRQRLTVKSMVRGMWRFTLSHTGSHSLIFTMDHIETDSATSPASAANLHSLTLELAKTDAVMSLTHDLQSLTMDPAAESDIAASLTSYPASSASRPSSASSAPSLSTSPDDQSKTVLPGAPVSHLFEVRDTPTAGRAVFATRDIPAGTLLWRADDLTVSVLLREYRREVCGQCFAYDYGRDMSIRDPVGFAFCSRECQAKWKQETGDVGVQAWTEVEKLVKKRSKEDNDMVELDLPRPTEEEIARAWEETEAQAELIRTARMAELNGGPITKQHRRAILKALQQPIQPDVMGFCVGGLVARYNSLRRWENLLSLAVDSTPYSNADNLRAFTRSYLHMLAVLPLPLLSLLTPETLQLLSSRDSHNSFGIRSLEDEGSEFFGYGCWPGASFFNHSCAPNVEKRREGRVWEFRAAGDMRSGDEINITYLGGEEKDMSREKRMATLRRNWGFDCGCKRCQEL